MRDVWNGGENTNAVVCPSQTCSVQMQPAIAGGRGREALLKAAQTQARGRATPQGSLPAELWQLLLQARPLCHVSVSSIPEICMGVFDAPSRSRRDAILHVEAWLDRLRAPLPGFSTSLKLSIHWLSAALKIFSALSRCRRQFVSCFLICIAAPASA